MPSVTFPTEYGGDGQTYNDGRFASGGHRTAFIPALSNSLAMAAFAKEKADECESFKNQTEDFVSNIDPFKPTNYHETVGNIAGSIVELNTGNMFFDTLSSSKAYSFSNPPSAGTAYSFTLVIETTSSVVIQWPSGVKWPDGSSPAAPSSGEASVYVFFTTDGGSTFYGFVAGEGMA